MSPAKLAIPGAIGAAYLLAAFCAASNDTSKGLSGVSKGSERPFPEPEVAQQPQPGTLPEETPPLVLPDIQQLPEPDRLRTLWFPPEKVHPVPWDLERERWIIDAKEPTLWDDALRENFESRIDDACIPVKIQGSEPRLDLKTMPFELPEPFPADVIHTEYWEDMRYRFIPSVQFQNNQEPANLDLE